MLGMFAPKVASESVPIAAAMREQSDGESAERELAEGEDATQDHVRCRVVPDPAHGWQCLADHDAAKDDVDQQSGQRREYRDRLLGNQAPAVGHLAEHLRSCQQHQEAGENARRNVDSGQPWDDAAKEHAAEEGDPEQHQREPHPLGGDLRLGHQSCLAHAGPRLIKLQSRSILVARRPQLTPPLLIEQRPGGLSMAPVSSFLEQA